jgi:hypothetical protein
MKRVLRVYVSVNRDGITAYPEHPEGRMRGPDSRKRVLLGGPTSLGDLNELQVRALVDLVFRRPGVHREADEAVFYDADAWARSSDSRRKVVHRVILP